MGLWIVGMHAASSLLCFFDFIQGQAGGYQSAKIRLLVSFGISQIDSSITVFCSEVKFELLFWQSVMSTVEVSLVVQLVKTLRAIQETGVRSLGREDPLGKETATHSSILAWEIPWTEETGGLQSLGSQRVRDYTKSNTVLNSKYSVQVSLATAPVGLKSNQYVQWQNARSESSPQSFWYKNTSLSQLVCQLLL